MFNRKKNRIIALDRYNTDIQQELTVHQATLTRVEAHLQDAQKENASLRSTVATHEKSLRHRDARIKVLEKQSDK